MTGPAPIEIETVTAVTEELVEAFARLIPQLSSSSPPPGPDQLAAIIGNAGTTVFAARLDGRMIGTLTLVMFPIPTGVRAWIEDVVVDREASGHHAGEVLTRAAVARAREAGAKTVDLTSRPSREAANHIYRKVGFELRDTNYYRLTLTD